MAKDLYEILSVSKTASQDEIRKAYRKLAHKYHPDTGKGDEAKFKEINEAYNILGDTQRRTQYDRFGAANMPPNWGQNMGGYENMGDIFSGFGDFGDIFSDIFGAGRTRTREQRGVDVETEINISFSESFQGIEKEFKLNKFEVCSRCHGNGAEPDKKVITCPRCHGQGQIRSTQNTIFGQVAVSQICERCNGTGKVPEVACKQCTGTGRERRDKVIKVKIPAGISNGMRIRIANEGEAGYQGGGLGDLYLRVNVLPDPKFNRQGDDIYSSVKISFVQAILGDEMKVETVEGPIELKIPGGTQPGTIFRLNNRGMPHLNRGGRGDHFVEAVVEVPKKLNREQKKLLEEYKSLS